VAQEKGIEAVLAIAQYSGESSARWVKTPPSPSDRMVTYAELTSRVRSDVIPALVEKALGAPRAGTKKKAMELAATFVEVENTGEGVMVSLICIRLTGRLTCFLDWMPSNPKLWPAVWRV
jgi:cytoskeleton-associated protein 5